jgi:hypothetical protein
MIDENSFITPFEQKWETKEGLPMTATETTIKASELRIGNLIYRDDGKPDVRKNYPVGVDADAMKSIQEGEIAFPVELTPEILEKAGFDKGKEGYWFKGGIEYNPGTFTLEGFGYCEIKHLHHLQNLYFALTGEELKIEL